MCLRPPAAASSSTDVRQFVHRRPAGNHLPLDTGRQRLTLVGAAASIVQFVADIVEGLLAADTAMLADQRKIRRRIHSALDGCPGEPIRPSRARYLAFELGG